jgi:hypothetical protein
MRKNILLLLFALAGIKVFPQDTQKAWIDSCIVSIDQQIGEEFLLPHIVSFTINRPAIGLQKTDIYFYYNAMSCENWKENQKGEMEITNNSVLSKVVVKYNIAASEFHTSEFFYSGDKLLLFSTTISLSADNSSDSSVVYFKNDNIINMQHFANGKVFETKNSDFSSDENNKSKVALASCKEYLALFKQLVSVEMNQH